MRSPHAPHRSPHDWHVLGRLFRFAYQASRITFECSTLPCSIQFDKAIGFKARALDDRW